MMKDGLLPAQKVFIQSQAEGLLDFLNLLFRLGDAALVVVGALHVRVLDFEIELYLGLGA